jgi:hypothetical protein
MSIPTIDRALNVVFQYGESAGEYALIGDTEGVKLCKKMVRQEIESLRPRSFNPEPLRKAWLDGVEAARIADAEAATEVDNPDANFFDYALADLRADEAECAIARLPMNSERRLWARY